VVAFHAGLGLLSGGFIGVDIFFVLSGFLVTRILMRDLATGGRIRWRNFYSRRVRRILPAALVVLLVTAFAYAIVASPSEMLDALGGFRAAFFYVANWFFIRQATDYFAANVNTNPVLHFWSLAIEEQFYLAWPLLLGALFLVTGRFGRRRWWLLRASVLAAALTSLVLALHIGSTNLDRAYYGTDTRAYELLAGALLALTPQLLRLGARARPAARWVSAIALGSLLLLATSAFTMSPITRGVLVALLAPVLILSLENARGGVKRVLSTRPFTYLGRISYGTYLWHWPIVVLVEHGHDPNPVQMFAISGLGATALAAISFRVLESPIRRARALDRFKAPVIAVGFATSILVGAVAMPAILDPGTALVAAAPGGGSQHGLKLLDWRVAKRDRPALPDCLNAPIEKCRVQKGTGKRVLLMGDSNARMWIPTFDAIAKRRGWSLYVASDPTCPWQRSLLIRLQGDPMCRSHQYDWYTRLIPKLDPDVIILVHQSLDAPARGYGFVLPSGNVVSPGMSSYEPALENASRRSLLGLRRHGRQLVIIEPTPDASAAANPLDCLSRGVAPEKCAYTVTRLETPLERFYRVDGPRLGVTTLNFDRLVCPRLPVCDAVIGSIIVKRDPNHLTATFAASLADQVDARFPR
jgi:peptidoglycan/LPS O-acetylase OafA/YrhL